MPDAFGICIVGYGLSGKVFHAPLVAATNGLSLAGVVSSDAGKVHADHPDARVFPSLDDALQDACIDAIVLASPDDTHAPLARSALESGRHVVIDKPFAPTLGEARKVAALAKERGRLVTVFQNRRWDADFLTLRALVDDGQLGEILQFESHFDRFKPGATGRWKDSRAGGVWFDRGAHLVDQALCLFGRPLSVFADIGVQKDGGNGLDYAHVLLRYPRTRVILHTSQSTPDSGLRFAVHGTKGSWIKHGLDPQEGQSSSGLLPGQDGWGKDPLEGRFVSATGETEKVRNRMGNYPRFYAELRAAYAGDGDNPVRVDEALDVMAVLEAALSSARTRREIELGA